MLKKFRLHLPSNSLVFQSRSTFSLFWSTKNKTKTWGYPKIRQIAFTSKIWISKCLTLLSSSSKLLRICLSSTMWSKTFQTSKFQCRDHLPLTLSRKWCSRLIKTFSTQIKYSKLTGCRVEPIRVLAFKCKTHSSHKISKLKLFINNDCIACFHLCSKPWISIQIDKFSFLLLGNWIRIFWCKIRGCLVTRHLWWTSMEWVCCLLYLSSQPHMVINWWACTPNSNPSLTWTSFKLSIICQG